MDIVKLFHLRGLQRHMNMWLVNHIFVGTRPCWFKIKRNLLNQLPNFKIGENTKIIGPIVCSATLEIGDNCWIGRNFTVNGNGQVSIGDNCDVAPDVAINTGGHQVGDAERRAGEGIITNVLIGKGCWLCTRCTIVNEVKVGDGCVLLPCSCVTKDVSSNTMVGGVPAKIIKSLG